MSEAPTDIIVKLRSRKAFFRNGAAWLLGNEPDLMCEEAAQEIERLRKELEQTESAYDSVVEYYQD